LWNPHAYAAAPLLGNAQFAVLSPFTALAYFLPIHAALGIKAILKSITAGLSMYWMLRVLALQPLAALAGALAFMFNGFLTVWLGWPQTNVGVWLPLLVGLTERLRQTRAWRYAGWLALVTGIQFLGGHPETSFHILIVIVCYALYRAGGPAFGRFLIQFTVGGSLGALLAAVQLLPFLHYFSHSAVFFHRREMHIVNALPTRAMIALLIPNHFGNPRTQNFWGPWNYNEISGSVGVLPWVLAPCALLGGWSRTGTKCFLGAAIFTGLVVYDLGPFPWALSKLPLFSMALNERLILILAFSLAALCGIGMEILIDTAHDGRSRIITGVKVLYFLLLIIVVGNLIADGRAILQHHLARYITVQTGTFLLLLTAGALESIHALRRGAFRTTSGICLLAIELLSVLTFASS
jgi:hypothetical protein